MYLSLAPPVGVPHTLRMVSGGEPGDETKALGLALRALRKRAGMTLAEAGDAVEPEAMSGQAWGVWERGERPGIHHPATQDRLLKAVHADRDELRRELERQRGLPVDELPGPVLPPPPATGGAHRVAVIARAKPDPRRGALVYDARQTDASADLGWMFGPNAGHLRMADDGLRPRVAAGQILHYDRHMPPREGQVCVVEAADGLHVAVYRQLAGGKLTVERINPPEPVEFELAEVRGVYAVRAISD